MWSDSDDEVVPILYCLAKIVDEEEESSRRWWVHPYHARREEEDILKKLLIEMKKYPEKFKNFTRMQVDTFDYLLKLVEIHIEKQNTNYRNSITPSERLFITLRYLASGESFQSLSHRFRCGTSTIQKLVVEICKCIWETVSPIYMPTPDMEKWTRIADEFGSRWNFPNCLEAIDGKHIRVQCPPNAGSEFYNYKKFHSIHLQAVVDARGQFICIDVGDFGRNCDSSVFKHSNFGKKLYNNELNLPNERMDLPFVFVADEGYPLLTNMMRPFSRKNLCKENKIYNYRLSRARRTVECAFGMLTKKFRLFENVILIHPNKVEILVLAACALHNLIREREKAVEEINIEEIEIELANQNFEINSVIRPSNAARNVRTQFVNYFNSANGSVPWQIKYGN